MEPNTGWRNKFFNFKMCNGVVEQRVEDGNIVVTGQLKPDMMPNSMVMFWAANPAHRNGSFSEVDYHTLTQKWHLIEVLM